MKERAGGLVSISAVAADLAQKRDPFDWQAAGGAACAQGGRGVLQSIASGAAGFLTHGPPESPDAAHPLGRLAEVESGVKPVASSSGG
jgi:hypothetical protein